MYQQDQFQYLQQPMMLSQPSQTETVAKYKIVQSSQVYKTLQKQLISIHQYIARGLDWALIFYHYFQWDKQKCLQKFFQKMQKILKQTYYTQQNYKFIQGKQTCKVCRTPSTKFLVNICKHRFCLDCWKQYIQYNINNNVCFFKCMEEGCKYPVLDSMIKQMLTKFKESSLEKKYVKLLIKNMTSKSKKVGICMGIDCNYCIQTDDVLLKFIQCTQCGCSFCFKCKNQVHRPCECRQVLKWKEIIQKQQANAKWILANTKVCPFCHKNVQRSSGCNYMLCAPPGGCGQSFCYVCSKPWLPDHADHFKCNVYKPGSQQDQKEKARQVLKKINFYGQKYISNDQAKKKLKVVLNECTQIQNKLFNQYQLSLTETQFIIDAYKTLVQSCDMLKWSYAFRFFMNDKNKKKDLFEFKQGQFQRYKQNLGIKLQVKLKNLLERMIGEKKPENQQIIKPKNQYKESLLKLKQQIVTYHIHTSKFMDQLSDMVQNGQVEL